MSRSRHFRFLPNIGPTYHNILILYIFTSPACTNMALLDKHNGDDSHDVRGKVWVLLYVDVIDDLWGGMVSNSSSVVVGT